MSEDALCTFCERRADSRDHVPPARIFAGPRPSTLITVPSCQPCNGGASRDDEYFKAVLALQRDVAATPIAKDVVDSVRRSFRRSEAAGFVARLRSAVQTMDVVSHSGEVVEPSAQLLRVEPARLNAVIKRTVRGLFRHHTARRLPLSAEVEAYGATGLLGKPPLPEDQTLEFVRIVSREKLHVVAEGVFEYRFALTEDGISSGVWVLFFYRKISFVALVLSPEDRSVLDTASGE
jgi:hypothetical protein